MSRPAARPVVAPRFGLDDLGFLARIEGPPALAQRVLALVAQLPAHVVDRVPARPPGSDPVKAESGDDRTSDDRVRKVAYVLVMSRDEEVFEHPAYRANQDTNDCGAGDLRPGRTRFHVGFCTPAPLITH